MTPRRQKGLITNSLVSHAQSTFLTCRVGSKEPLGALHLEGGPMGLHVIMRTRLLTILYSVAANIQLFGRVFPSHYPQPGLSDPVMTSWTQLSSGSVLVFFSY